MAGGAGGGECSNGRLGLWLLPTLTVDGCCEQGEPTEGAVLTILLHFYRRNYPAFANAAKVKEFIHYYQAKAAAVRLSRTMIAGIWVAFFQECQQ